MPARNLGPTSWSLERDREGYSTYRIEYAVGLTEKPEGPTVVLSADQLPQPGDVWDQGGDEVNFDAICTPEVSVRPSPQFIREWPFQFLVGYVFTDKPVALCQEHALAADPLLEPPIVRWEQREEKITATKDRYGYPIVNSAFEPIRDHQVEFDDTVSLFSIQVNLPTIARALIEEQSNTLNDAPIFGYDTETVRFIGARFETKFHGRCECFLGVVMQFAHRRDGWVKEALDECSKALRGHWDRLTGEYQLDLYPDGRVPSSTNSKDFVQMKDQRGENVRMVMNGAGVPADVVVRVGGNFLSLDNGNAGHPINDAAHWVPISGDPDGRPWTNRGWKRGSVVTFTGNYFIALKDVPAGEVDPLSAPEYFEALGPVAPADASEWAVVGVYAKGDYVQAPGSVSKPGRIVVEYYETSNFLELPGLPATLECPGH